MGRASAVAAAAVAALVAGDAGAAPAAEFYKGKTITWVVGSGAGGSYGLYARVLAPHFARHIPGNPRITIRHDPQGGGRHAADYVHNAAPKDGTVICMTRQDVPLFQVLRPRDAKFDVFKWSWIGNMATIRGVMAVWHEAPATSLIGAKGTEIVMGASGRSSATYINPTLANSLLGTRFKLVEGYRGPDPLFEAIEQGEIQGFALSALAFKLRSDDWAHGAKIRFLVQTGLEPDPDLPEVPVMWKLGTTKRDQEILKLVATTSRFGRALWAPPGTPKERVETLRAAFEAALTDPKFLEDMHKRRLPVEPVSAADLSALTRALAATDPKTVDAARRALHLD